jgi:DNA polymerase-4
LKADLGQEERSRAETARRTILHVDMDAFFAAVEQRDRPELLGLPVIIGADPKGGLGRGVVSTASYEARRHGVFSAMPISRAFRLCPQGVFLPVDMEKYARVSDQVMEVFGRYTDLVETLSIDEAFLDVSGCRRLGSGEAIASSIKAELKNAVSLTASIGVAASKLVAKIASDLEKPDGLVVVPGGTEEQFLAPLPIRRLWGVGPRTEERLLRAGVRTIGDLARLAGGALERRLGAHGRDLVDLARGIDPRPVIATDAMAKSVGREHTFERDTTDREMLRRTLLELSDDVARRLRAQGIGGRTITLKYRDESFHTVTRCETLAAPTDASAAIFDIATRLLRAVHGQKRVRLLGVSVSGFDERQMELFQPASSPVDSLRDAVRERFGRNALTRASLLKKK